MDIILKEQKRPTLMNQALNHVREAIIKGRLKPGDRLVESQLAEQMRISRFPVREALRYLEKEGLVENTPFKGTYVSKFTEKDMEEVFSLRGAIEGLALQILANRIDKKKLDVLEAIIKDMETSAHDGDADKVVANDLRFHRTICEMTGHRKLFFFWETLEHHIYMFLTIEKKVYDPPEYYVASHYPILEALKKNDSELAIARLRIHLEDAMTQIRKGFWTKRGTDGTASDKMGLS
jgi:DNA-binding GntR family transcriptional regulator